MAIQTESGQGDPASTTGNIQSVDPSKNRSLPDHFLYEN